MELLSKDYLERSPIVANNRMNRDRNAVGVNSYERDIWLSPIEYLADVSHQKSSISWLDICCGRAKALIQTAQHLERQFPNKHYHLTGIDLVDMCDPIPTGVQAVSIITESFFNFNATQKFDLITCVHGLHYLGDKLAAIQKACSLLTPDGLFVANLDILNIKSQTKKDFHKDIAKWLQSNGILYNKKRHLITVNGGRSVTIPFKYIGADDQAGPNYTGQEVVDSHYE
jgi:SAM-dependent methyltransferase